ncbi:MAG: Rieske 2Fe-2S domain-containing protein, partial [Woeseiaceae bacterium]
MLTKDDNALLTRVSPGTPMGNLLRRYWTPALLSSEAPEPDSPPIRVRLLGEDLVAFRDTNGEVGLVAQACPHRGASLFFGRNEEAGLRCVYHGWKFDLTGECIDMPSEPAESNFKNKVRVTAYPTHESGGIVWTYMGPQETMPAFRDLGTDSLPREDWFASKLYSPCNWVQGLEGNIDTAHISFLHQYHATADIEDDGTDKPGYVSSTLAWKLWREDGAPRIETLDTWYGYRYAGVRTTPNGHTYVRITDFIMPYATYIAATPIGGDLGIMMVPIDDHSFWRYNFSVRNSQRRRARAANPNVFNQTPFLRGGMRTGIIPRTHHAGNDYQIDREMQRDTTYAGIQDFVSQDMAVTESMGLVFDRTGEHLG